MIAFAWKGDAPSASLKTLIERADRYAGQHSVDFVEAAVRIEAGARYDWMRLGASPPDFPTSGTPVMIKLHAPEGLRDDRPEIHNMAAPGAERRAAGAITIRRNPA
jgi:hypothetical protein